MSRDGPTAKAYPTPEQYQRWKDRADELDMSVSEFIASMTEAGMKADRGFDVAIHPDETTAELREQRNDLRDELQHARDRIEALEDRLYDRERAAVLDGVVERQPATFDDVVEHVKAGVPDRVTTHLDELVGDRLHRNPNTGEYALADGGGA